MPGLSCMNSDFLCLRIIYLFREPRSIVNVAPSRERVGAYRTTHLIPLGMAQAPGLGHAGRRRIGRSSRVPPPWGRTPLRCSASAYTLQFRGEDQQGLRLCFSLQCYHSKCCSLCQDIFSLSANKYFRRKMGASPSAQTEGGAPALLWKSVQNCGFTPLKSEGQAHMGNHKGGT